MVVHQTRSVNFGPKTSNSSRTK